MSKMKCTLAVLIGALSIATLTTNADAKGFKAGQYTMQIFSGPDHQGLNPTCITFVKTGGVAEFKSSGTWTVSDTLAGNYVADGKDLRWYGSKTGSQIALDFHADVKTGKGGVDLWFFSNSPITAVDDGQVTLTPGCD